MHLRSLKRVRGEVSLYDPIGVDREGNEITLVDGRKQPRLRRAKAGGPQAARFLMPIGD